jgi:hypothetical protein
VNRGSMAAVWNLNLCPQAARFGFWSRVCHLLSDNKTISGLGVVASASCPSYSGN